MYEVLIWRWFNAAYKQHNKEPTILFVGSNLYFSGKTPRFM